MDFKDKKITVMGLGLIGKGYINPEYLAQKGAEIIATDLKTEEELRPTIEKLKKYPNITFSLGGHKFEDFENRDFILKNQGIPLDSPYIEHAREHGVPIEMDESLFMKMRSGVTMIGITGTRGKSTTTHLVYKILKDAGKRVFIAGNLPGTSILPLLDEVKSGDIVVAELSSWQLQGFNDSKVSPQISVFTTFMSDHLNYYKNDLELYFNDKAAIYRYQKPEDILVVGEDIVEKISDAKSKVIIARRENVPGGWDIQIPGEHNKLNIACAMAVARSLDIDEKYIQKSIESFTGVEGRLQKIKEIKGVEIWNDNNATTPDATIAAIKALAPKPLVLIMGGADKNIDMSGLVEIVKGATKKIILLPGTGTDRLLKDYDLVGRDIEKVLNMKDAVEVAIASATEGDAILFSPAFASFGLFKNEYDRNDQFVNLVNQL